METVIIGSDHAGFGLKVFLKEKLEQEGIPVIDVGCEEETSCDYPEFARMLCEKIQEGTASRGILICGTDWGCPWRQIGTLVFEPPFAQRNFTQE